MELNIDSKVAYWCKTEELAKEFLKECDEQDITWYDDTKATNQTMWSIYYDRTCYDIENYRLTYGRKQGYIDYRYTIIEYKGKEETSYPNNAKSNELSTIKQMQELTADLSTLIATRKRIKSEIVQMGLDEEIKRIKAILCDNIMEV